MKTCLFNLHTQTWFCVSVILIDCPTNCSTTRSYPLTRPLATAAIPFPFFLFFSLIMAFILLQNVSLPLQVFIFRFLLSHPVFFPVLLRFLHWSLTEATREVVGMGALVVHLHSLHHSCPDYHPYPAVSRVMYDNYVLSLGSSLALSPTV